MNPSEITREFIQLQLFTLSSLAHLQRPLIRTRVWSNQLPSCIERSAAIIYHTALGPNSSAKEEEVERNKTLHKENSWREFMTPQVGLHSFCNTQLFIHETCVLCIPFQKGKASNDTFTSVECGLPWYVSTLWQQTTIPSAVYSVQGCTCIKFFWLMSHAAALQLLQLGWGLLFTRMNIIKQGT